MSRVSRILSSFIISSILLCLTPSIFEGNTITGKAVKKASSFDSMQFYAPAFPRLGMWWPNPWEQPLDRIADYDWVILGDWSSDFIDPLRSINPDILLLNSTNACEVSFLPGDDAYNAYLQEIPYQWYLTQVGTTLRTAVDAKSTVLAVEALNSSNENGDFQLFIPGDAALIGSESVYIEAVDSGKRTLTVRRGYVRPASSHPAGSRIAAHITFWPDSWVLNVSTLSPTGIADPAVGPERWVDYNARIGAKLLTDPRWSGILVDRSDPDQSWLIGNSTARTIDPDQSNRLLSDYSEFDEAWNSGLRNYLDSLRASIGDERIIYLNWGIDHFSAINGSNFEGFPHADGDYFGSSWRSMVLGPRESGSYFEWMERARKPNLTMIETYEDDSGPDPTSTVDYDNPCVKPGFTPNYQKMRFGLTTALLNDGYFSYEMSTQGHGSLCLMWFDEYDNAGEGRGYLGNPLSPAQKAVPELSTPGLLPSGSFETPAGLSAWTIWADTGYDMTISLDTLNPAVGMASARLDVTESGGEDWRAELLSPALPVIKGKDYSLFFYARADKTRNMSVWVQQSSDPWKVWLWYGEISLTTGWQKFELVVKSEGSDNSAELVFGLGAATGSVWLDGLKLQEGNTEVWRRDFNYGISLVNATSETVTVDLKGSFRKIDGVQDRIVNNGKVVTKVTIPARDGVILNCVNDRDERAKIEGMANYYKWINSAYSQASTGKTILAQAVTFKEDLIFAGGKIITLKGGYSCDFSANPGYTTIRKLTIRGTDRLNISGIIIK
jgi:hypothetical protein